MDPTGIHDGQTHPDSSAWNLVKTLQIPSTKPPLPGALACEIFFPSPNTEEQFAV